MIPLRVDSGFEGPFRIDRRRLYPFSVNDIQFRPGQGKLLAEDFQIMLCGEVMVRDNDSDVLSLPCNARLINGSISSIRLICLGERSVGTDNDDIPSLIRLGGLAAKSKTSGGKFFRSKLLKITFLFSNK